jgi:hypothetical protein
MIDATTSQTEGRRRAPFSFRPWDRGCSVGADEIDDAVGVVELEATSALLALLGRHKSAAMRCRSLIRVRARSREWTNDDDRHTVCRHHHSSVHVRPCAHVMVVGAQDAGRGVDLATRPGVRGSRVCAYLARREAVDLVGPDVRSTWRLLTRKPGYAGRSVLGG